jgi:hypothetical protein
MGYPDRFLTTYTSGLGRGEMISQYYPGQQRLYVEALDVSPKAERIGYAVYKETISQLAAMGKPVNSIAGEMGGDNWLKFQATGDYRQMPSIKIREELGFHHHEWIGEEGPSGIVLSTR